MTKPTEKDNKALAAVVVDFLKVPHDGSNAYYLARTSLLTYYGALCAGCLVDSVPTAEDKAWVLDNRPYIPDDAEIRRREDEAEKD